MHIADLSFDPILRGGYRGDHPELEPDLVKAQEAIRAADHLVFVYPTWWGTYPALLKGFFDRTFLPGFAFKYREDSVFWDRLLKGKSARLIVTMDAPPLFYALVYRSPGHNSVRRAILEFCGVRPVRITSFGPVRGSGRKTRNRWLQKVEQLGKQLK